MKDKSSLVLESPRKLRDYETLLTASKALLQKIDDITTDEFSKGGERYEREQLRAAIQKLN